MVLLILVMFYTKVGLLNVCFPRKAPDTKYNMPMCFTCMHHFGRDTVTSIMSLATAPLVGVGGVL